MAFLKIALVPMLLVSTMLPQGFESRPGGDLYSVLQEAAAGYVPNRTRAFKLTDVKMGPPMNLPNELVNYEVNARLVETDCPINFPRLCRCAFKIGGKALNCLFVVQTTSGGKAPPTVLQSSCKQFQNDGEQFC